MGKIGLNDMESGNDAAEKSGGDMDKNGLFETTPVFETKRLILRRLSMDDAPDYLEIFRDENVTRHYDVETMTSLGQAQELIEKHNRFFGDKWSIRYALYEKEDKKTIGTFGLYDFKEKESVEIGFELNYRYWKKGYMTEALNAIISFLFTNLDIRAIFGGFLKSNTASENIMKRLLFVKDKTVENVEIKPRVFETVYFYKLKRETFEANKGHFGAAVDSASRSPS